MGTNTTATNLMLFTTAALVGCAPAHPAAAPTSEATTRPFEPRTVPAPTLPRPPAPAAPEALASFRAREIVRTATRLGLLDPATPPTVGSVRLDELDPTRASIVAATASGSGLAASVMAWLPAPLSSSAAAFIQPFGASAHALADGSAFRFGDSKLVSPEGNAWFEAIVEAPATRDFELFVHTKNIVDRSRGTIAFALDTLSRILEGLEESPGVPSQPQAIRPEFGRYLVGTTRDFIERQGTWLLGGDVTTTDVDAFLLSEDRDAAPAAATSTEVAPLARFLPRADLRFEGAVREHGSTSRQARLIDGGAVWRYEIDIDAPALGPLMGTIASGPLHIVTETVRVGDSLVSVVNEPEGALEALVRAVSRDEASQPALVARSAQPRGAHMYADLDIGGLIDHASTLVASQEELAGTAMRSWPLTTAFSYVEPTRSYTRLSVPLPLVRMATAFATAARAAAAESPDGTGIFRPEAETQAPAPTPRPKGARKKSTAKKPKH
jgi:hypothetical protein